MRASRLTGPARGQQPRFKHLRICTARRGNDNAGRRRVAKRYRKRGVSECTVGILDRIGEDISPAANHMYMAN
jgi:hypothetical protein